MDLTFSQALRLGSMACEKAIGTRHAPDGSKCAIGAAEFAIGYSTWPPKDKDAEHHWPILMKWFTHPVTGRRMELCRIVATLNNGEDWDGWFVIGKIRPWSREKIADFVERLEAEEAAQVGETTLDLIRSDSVGRDVEAARQGQ